MINRFIIRGQRGNGRNASSVKGLSLIVIFGVPRPRGGPQGCPHCRFRSRLQGRFPRLFAGRVRGGLHRGSDGRFPRCPQRGLHRGPDRGPGSPVRRCPYTAIGAALEVRYPVRYAARTELQQTCVPSEPNGTPGAWTTPSCPRSSSNSSASPSRACPSPSGRGTAARCLNGDMTRRDLRGTGPAGWGHDPTWRRSGSCPRSAKPWLAVILVSPFCPGWRSSSCPRSAQARKLAAQLSVGNQLRKSDNGSRGPALDTLRIMKNSIVSPINAARVRRPHRTPQGGHRPLARDRGGLPGCPGACPGQAPYEARQVRRRHPTSRGVATCPSCRSPSGTRSSRRL